MEINENEEFQNQDDIVLDVDYKELSHQETIGTLSEKFDIGRTSMNSLVTGLEKGNVLSTSNKPKGSWRKLNDDDIEVIKKAVDLIKTEDLSISAAVDKMVAEYNNEKIPPKNTSELYKLPIKVIYFIKFCLNIVHVFDEHIFHLFVCSGDLLHQFHLLLWILIKMNWRNEDGKNKDSH